MNLTEEFDDFIIEDDIVEIKLDLNEMQDILDAESAALEDNLDLLENISLD
ncbi:hypothetical protein [Carboxylicivirga linearis]|uniref:Uncharacterized protein n=1 Tax=Carboxylicivirga linearis TaxID=1628157 RepID=A0ABS5K2Y5_9BACT|nr:hypothetical protein [Carboxylicivirga linearis]MBS2100841.1 hypothetical protein [Carboxylicivirga linearis]